VIEALFRLVLLAIPVAAITWTVTHEELFREPREYFVRRSQSDPRLWKRKLFYMFTCEYCFSHYVTAAIVVITDFRLLFDDWRGYVVAGFSVVWVANHLVSAYGRLRLGIRSERLEIGLKEVAREQADGPRQEERRAARRAG
jgi:hypothetical protein